LGDAIEREKRRAPFSGERSFNLNSMQERPQKKKEEGREWGEKVKLNSTDLRKTGSWKPRKKDARKKKEKRKKKSLTGRPRTHLETS